MFAFSCLLLGAVAATTASPLDTRKSSVPSYVVDYAPIVYLFSGENYKPADIGAQVTNTRPKLNYTALRSGVPSPLTLDNLNKLNHIPNSRGGKDIYLTSTADPTTDPRPQYLYGVTPDSKGKTQGAISSAIITVQNTTAGHLDAFYFYFYAFDYGGDYFSLNIGDHIGDWEHNMIRFNTSTARPTAIWYSQHSSGEAFTYAATQKHHSIRPVTYCANGTHANYATPGTHDHTIPGVNLPDGPIEDHTDAGALWDPTLSAYYYAYDPATSAFTPYDGAAPTAWLSFTGKWGDEMIPQTDPRQSCAFGIDALCKYVSGPTGPADKDLVRTNVCPDSDDHCEVFPVLLP